MVRRTLKYIWLFLRFLPILKCPVCKGKGGWFDYYHEWDECTACTTDFSNNQLDSYLWLVDYSDSRLLGRVSPCQWFRIKKLVENYKKVAEKW